VKNKTPAQVQITAEQILREARERVEQETPVPKQKITNEEELGSTGSVDGRSSRTSSGECGGTSVCG